MVSSDIEDTSSDAGSTMAKSTVRSKGYSRSTNLSHFYGTLLVLLGLVVPMTEALRGNWMSNHIVAFFVAYLYSVSSLFVIYLIICEEVLKKHHVKHMKEKQAAAKKANFEMFSSTDFDTGVEVFDNLALDDSPVPTTSDDNLSNTTSISMSSQDSKSANEEDEDKEEVISKVVFFTGNPKSQLPKPSHQGVTLRYRHRSNTNSALEESTTEAIHDYVASHMETSTLANQETSYFLKGGSLIFAMANMVYVALQIESSHRMINECGATVIVYPHYLHLVFIVLQTFILLKECKYGLKKNKALAKFGLAHLISTNLCVWLRFLMLEVTEAIEESEHETHEYHNDTEHNSTGCTVDSVSSTAGHYLFPFILEYSLVAMSSCAFMLFSINIRVSKELYKAIRNAVLNPRTPSETQGQSNDTVARHFLMDGSHPFHKAHTGLFLGVLLMTGSIISMILFFYYNSVDEVEQATLCYTTSENIMLLFLLIGCILGMVKLADFKVDIHESNTFDHILLLTSVSFYVILELFEFLSSLNYILEENTTVASVMTLLVTIMSLLQCAAQTVFILDGMQRVATGEDQITNKYGRSIITFLIVGNVAAWVFKSFQEKKAYAVPEYEFFGNVAWAIIHSVAFPLVLFFKFHSSICLAHMWHHCYEAHDHTLVENKIYV